MPPRYSYWTIIAGGLPTAFRAAERDELLPTFTRLREKHPDAEMRWFARGTLWASPDEARQALRDGQRGGARSRGPRKGDEAPRGRDWRPGGEHRDPRQKYIDAKKARNAERRKQKFARRQQGESGSAGGSERKPWQSDRERQGVRDKRGLNARGSGAARGDSHRQQSQPDRRREGAKWSTRGGAARPSGARPKPHASQERGGWKPREDGRRFRDDRPKGPQGDRDRRARSTRDERDERRGRPESQAGTRRSTGKPSGRGGRPDAFRKGGDDRRPGRPWSDSARNTDRHGNRPAHGHAGGDRSHRDANGARPRTASRPQGKPKRAPGSRRFEPPAFERGQGTEEPTPPQRPRGPNREPQPGESPEPSPPPRPSEPATVPPGPPERGRLVKPRRRS